MFIFLDPTIQKSIIPTKCKAILVRRGLSMKPLVVIPKMEWQNERTGTCLRLQGLFYFICKFQKKFRGEAAPINTYLINKMPTMVLQGSTPIWFLLCTHEIFSLTLKYLDVFVSFMILDRRFKNWMPAP